ncbi:MAG: 2-dehydro-3-deoxygalactonokinase, partial [Paracoccaceae bacterium]
MIQTTRRSLDTHTVAVDWGTSSFRLWLLDRQGGVRANLFKACGMHSLRPNQFQGVLDAALGEISAPDEAPVLICGMAGAAQGWVETPYVPLPTCTTQLAKKVVRVPGTSRPVFIIPGLSQDPMIAPDVIRGEETLLLGSTLKHNVQGTVCLPGTHSKWAEIENGVISRFQTSMTGELFALLSKQSTLSCFTSNQVEGFETSAAFEVAVSEALRYPQRILQALFSVRARPLLLGSNEANNMYARLSGLLIGLEIAGQGLKKEARVALISNSQLASTYRMALSIA